MFCANFIFQTRSRACLKNHFRNNCIIHLSTNPIAQFKIRTLPENNQNKISNRSSFSTDRSVAKELPLFACIFVTFPQRYDYLRDQ